MSIYNYRVNTEPRRLTWMEVKQAIYQHWCSTKHDALSQSRDSWVIIIPRLAQKWNCLTLAHNETILSSLSFSLCWGLFSSNRFYPSASFLLCFLPHSLTRKKVDLSNSSVSRRDTYHWIGCHLNSGLEMIVAFVVLSLCYIVSVFNDRLFASDNRTLAKFERSGIAYRNKVFRDLYLWPPQYFHQNRVSAMVQFWIPACSNPQVYIGKRKAKTKTKTKNKTDVNPYRIFLSQWQFILFLS